VVNGPGTSDLADLLSTFELEGYRGQMAARPGGRILCMGCHQESDADDMQVDGLQRVEGASDPADMLAVAALVCPICSTHGTLVLSYGPEADPDDSEVLSLLGDVDG
jgi:hypothetical protein